MTRLRSTVLLAIACGLPTPHGPGRAAGSPMGPASVGAIVSLTDPVFRQVVQRRDDNYGNVVFAGTYAGNVDGFQVRSVLRPGMPGTARGWSPLVDVSIADGHFVGVSRQAAGGFYDLQIRPVFGGQAGQVGATVTVSAVGVGEVFITAGQSNSTNWGTPTYFAPDVRVSCFDDGPGRGLDPTYSGSSFRWAYDPQPAIDQSFAGSPWPIMANNLAVALNMPIGLYAAGCGGTVVGEWVPGHVKAATLTTPEMVLFDRLTNAITYFNDRGGVRAVLWDQGESDYTSQTDPFVYEASLRLIIGESRTVTGAPVKWMVAQATTPLTSNVPLRAGLEQAQVDVVDFVTTFPGPNTDSIGLPYRIYLDGLPVHFNAQGLTLLGGYWGVYVANTPGFIAPGALP